ncbi:hypothetical protein SAMN05660330_02994 [Desulforhopalus singaporensis]|uniref:Uncharacterized protein n=1 Tax=Desulforhopalus singaporensis TaxID=91360 RepID=A0A1H0TAV2_9BACT|nr:hypothetical protein SAMN05660330_02994 [Desulforhopalus singaporensis]
MSLKKNHHFRLKTVRYCKVATSPMATQPVMPRIADSPWHIFCKDPSVPPPAQSHAKNRRITKRKRVLPAMAAILTPPLSSRTQPHRRHPTTQTLSVESISPRHNSYTAVLMHFSKTNNKSRYRLSATIRFFALFIFFGSFSTRKFFSNNGQQISTQQQPPVSTSIIFISFIWHNY